MYSFQCGCLDLFCQTPKTLNPKRPTSDFTRLAKTRDLRGRTDRINQGSNRIPRPCCGLGFFIFDCWASSNKTYIPTFDLLWPFIPFRDSLICTVSLYHRRMSMWNAARSCLSKRRASSMQESHSPKVMSFVQRRQWQWISIASR